MRRPLAQRIFYKVMQAFCRLFAVVVFRYRSSRRDWIPETGGGLVCSNHQSYFDPVVVGVCSNRRMNYLARKTLFRFLPFRWLISYLDAIPIDRDGMGLSGIKETLRRLKRGELVLIFPEGTRTRDGEMGSLKPGFISVARRSRVPLIPVAMDGAYQAWPRGGKFPRPSRVCVVFGEPLTPDEISELEDEQLIEMLEQRMRSCLHDARQWRSKRGAS